MERVCPGLVVSRGYQEGRHYMKTTIIALSAAALIASTPAVFAQGTSSQTPSQTPGHQMQDKGSVPGTSGASGYTPGHQMQEKGTKDGTKGASGYAPGQTSGSGTSEGESKRMKK
jgi:hypothetical protein